MQAFEGVDVFSRERPRWLLVTHVWERGVAKVRMIPFRVVLSRWWKKADEGARRSRKFGH